MKLQRIISKLKSIDKKNIYFLLGIILFGTLLGSIVKTVPLRGGSYIPLLRNLNIVIDRTLEIILGIFYTGMDLYSSWIPFNEHWLIGRMWTYAFYSFVVGVMSLYLSRNNKHRCVWATIFFVGICTSLSIILMAVD